MNKKPSKLACLMAAGIISGALISQTVHAAAATEAKASSAPKQQTLMDLAAQTGGNITYQLMTEDELLLELNEEGTRVYNNLSPEGKQLALRTASRSCNGTNECSGLNACATDKNKCAGKGSCKGQTKCAISDKNFAVKLSDKKMAEKRLNAQKK
jgi:hypothetical protein